MIRLITSGESHGKGLVGMLEGLPSGLKLDLNELNNELRRRQKGYGRGNRMNIEQDSMEIISGVRNCTTLGSPISYIIKNKDHKVWEDVMSAEECDITKRVVTACRPGHADFSGCVKYNFDDARNILERASARETACRVAGGAICKQFLKALGISIASHVINIGGVTDYSAAVVSIDKINQEVDKNDVRCLNEAMVEKMRNRIDEAILNKDTLGGQVKILVSGMPVGIGSHVTYDKKLDYLLMGAIGSVQAVKAVEIGMGTKYANEFGSYAQDQMYVTNDGEHVYRKTNYAGGIEGGISNGENIIITATIKPIPTVMKGLQTIDIKTHQSIFSALERSDYCAVPAAGVVIENVVAHTLASAILDCLGGDYMEEVQERMEKKRAKCILKY